jgi:hypothetical protein
MPRDVAAEYCGVSVTHFLEYGPLPARKIGAKLLWDRYAIDRWLDGNESLTDNWGKALEEV